MPELDDTIEVEEVRGDDIKMDTFRSEVGLVDKTRQQKVSTGCLDPHSDRDCSGVHRGSDPIRERRSCDEDFKLNSTN